MVSSDSYWIAILIFLCISLVLKSNGIRLHPWYHFLFACVKVAMSHHFGLPFRTKQRLFGIWHLWTHSKSVSTLWYFFWMAYQEVRIIFISNWEFSVFILFKATFWVAGKYMLSSIFFRFHPFNGVVFLPSNDPGPFPARDFRCAHSSIHRTGRLTHQALVPR